MFKSKFGNIHLFSFNEKYFVFQGDSLQLFELNEENYTKINKARECSNAINEIDDGLMSELLETEIVVNEEEYEEKILNIKNNEDNFALSHITLSISNDCNLNCKYCFGDGGTYHNDRMLMPFETARQGIDFLLSHCKNTEVLNVTFFGGEPLLNFDVMKKIVIYCREKEKENGKKFKFSVSTNGTIINDEIINFIKKYDISVTISIDGPKSTHDRYRCYMSGKGSFDLIEVTIKKLLASSVKKVNARATICSINPNVKQIENGLREFGFNSIHMTLVDVPYESQLFMDSDSITKTIAGYYKLAEEYLYDIKSKRVNRNKTFDELLYVLFNKKLKLRSCAAAVSSVAISANGEIYPCHRFMGDKKYLLGNLREGVFEESIKPFKNLNVLNLEDCNVCWARFLCAGACIHSRVKHSKLNKAYSHNCGLYKKIYEIALYIYYDLKVYDENILLSMFSEEQKQPTTFQNYTI